jgi:hypothetical protein
MLSKFIRVFFALTAISPLSISLAYIYAVHEKNLLYAGIAILVCIALGLLSIAIVHRARSNLERLPIVVQKAKSADKEVIGFFIAYVLPLVFKGESAPELGAWILAAAILLFVLWSTHSLQVNPILGMLGYHFYEVETKDGITFLLITRRNITNVKTIHHVVQLTEYGVLDAE